MRRTFDGIIFDMDGILVNVTRSYREAMRMTASKFLCREVSKIEVDNIKNKIGMNNDWDATYALINNSAIPYAKVKKYFQELYLGNKERKGFIDNEPLLISKQILTRIMKKYGKLAIATGRPRLEAEYVIKKNKLNGLFNSIVAMEDVASGKPAPDILIKVISKLKLKNTVYIGDSPSDVISAQNAGIPCIYVGTQNIGSITCSSILQVIEYLL
ncbi:HAD-IA family hydrolase [Candidatus Roizmanbacteria bacterium]|nr:HAD-IA family hydrolase [Candidatus Roizmanbacteria bacterium]